MKKILVIEDEVELLEEINEILGFEGYEVLMSSDGFTGIEIAKDNLPDLILSDIMMPGLDGFGIVKQLKQHSKTTGIPIVMITALSERVNIRKVIELGANDYLIKPFTRIELLGAVNAQLNLVPSAREKERKGNIEEFNQFPLALSHEFRTPLNVILGFSGLLKDNPEEYSMKSIAEMGQSIYNEGYTLFEIINKYLIFINIEFYKIGCCFSEIPDLDIFSSKVIFDIAERHKRPDDLRLSSINTNVRVDKERFEFVLRELTNNAFKFSQKGSLVKVKSTLINGNVEYIFADEGVGQPQTNIEEINDFAEFEAGIPNNQEIFGLLICKKIIQLHKGTFMIENNADDGTTITFTIPV